MAGTRRKHTAADRRRWRETNAKRYDERRRMIQKHKTNLGCADCGWGQNDADYHPSALDFDHRPGENKSRNISRMPSYSWEAILAEIAKCDVVCARCHRLRTVRRHEDGDMVIHGRPRDVQTVLGQPQLFDE